MENSIIFNHIHKYLNGKEIPKYNLDKSHVFYSIHSNLINGISIEDKISMLYHFEEIKKILSYSRNNKLHLAELKLKNLEKLNLQYSNKIADIGITSIHLPMLAYVDYVKSDFNEAEKNLKNSIDLLYTLIHHGIEDCKIACLEQYFNLFKVYVKLNNYEQAAKIVFEIFLYITKNNSELITYPFLNSIKDEIDCLHYYINNILKVLLVKNKRDTIKLLETKLNIKHQLVLRLKKADLHSEYFSHLKSMLVFVLDENDNPNSFFSEFNIENIISPDTPSFLQYLILEKYKNQNLENNTELSIIRKYYAEVLDMANY